MAADILDAVVGQIGSRVDVIVAAQFGHQAPAPVAGLASVLGAAVGTSIRHIILQNRARVTPPRNSAAIGKLLAGGGGLLGPGLVVGLGFWRGVSQAGHVAVLLERLVLVIDPGGGEIVVAGVDAAQELGGPGVVLVVAGPPLGGRLSGFGLLVDQGALVAVRNIVKSNSDASVDKNVNLTN